jgi:hypothetical protein
MSEIRVGPMTGQQAAGFQSFGGIRRFEEPLHRLVEGS